MPIAARPVALVALLVAGGCASTPPEISALHDAEGGIIGGLRESHVALVEGYTLQKRALFDSFFFDTYLPIYRRSWLEAFRASRGREYDEERDFALLASDVVAEYQELGSPIDAARAALIAALDTEYGDALAAHEQVADWLRGARELGEARQRGLTQVLSAARPGLGLASIDSAVAAAIRSGREAVAGGRRVGHE